MRVLAIAGSLRQGSHNRTLLQAAANEFPSHVELELFDGLAELPHYDEDADVDPVHPAVHMLRGSLARADAVLIATPEYNASVPGALKNAFDWASRPFPCNCLRDKPVAVIGASTGLFGAVWAQAELRKVLAAIGARVVDADLPVAQAHQAFDKDGSLREPELRASLKAIVEQLLRETVSIAAEQAA